MNREQLIVELTKLNPNESREDVEDELMPLIDEYAKRVALEARIDELEAKKDEAYHIWNILFNECGIQPNAPLMQKIDNRIAELKAQQEEE